MRTNTNQTAPRWTLAAIALVAWGGLLTRVQAQVGPGAAAPAATAAELAQYDANRNGRLDPEEQAARQAGQDRAEAARDEPLLLSPFEVSTSSDVGYEAKDTLSGSRLNTELKDVASQVQVMTPEFMKDLGITDLNDAIAYSLNAETAAEIFDINNANNAGNEGSIQAFSGGIRTRGLGGTVIGRDFFQTITPVDAYNTERFTLAPGANNTLFGNATPAGSIDSTTKRARVHRRSYSFEYRLDDRGSARAVLDVNQPIVPNVAAIRWVGLRDRQNEWREPSFADQNRSFLSATFTPDRRFSLRGWYEHYEAHNQPVRNTLLRDRASAWIAAGRPAFDNSATLAGVTASPQRPWIRTPAARTNPFYVMNADVPAGFIRLINPTATTFGTVQTVGQAQLSPPPDNFDWSMVDESLAPTDIAFAGNAVQAVRRARNFGAVINANPFKNFFIELGQSREVFKHRFVDLFRFSELNLFADANRWAVDQAGQLRRAGGALVPNPYFGRLYMEDVFIAAGLTMQELDQQRASAVYQLDLTERKGWTRWLGRHNVTGMYDRLIQDQTGAGQRFDPTAADPVSGGPEGTARNVFFRYYLPDASNPGSYAVNLPFDPLQSGLIELPNSGGVQLRGYGAPQGAGGAQLPSRRVVHSRSFALQSFLWKDRIVFNFSRRTDHVANHAIAGFDWPRTGSGGFEYLDRVWDSLGMAQREESSAGTKTKDNKGVVVHPFRWLSAHYSDLANAQVTGLTRYSLTGEQIELGTGKGREYGFTIRLPDNRLSIRVNKYVSTLQGVQGSPFAFDTNVAQATVGAGGNNLRNDVTGIEQAVLQAGAPTDPRWAEYQQMLLGIPFRANENPGNWDPPNIVGGGTVRDSYDFVVDRESRGYEVTMVGNPTPQWRLSVSGAQNKSMETNLGPSYFEFINARLPVWGQYLDAPTWRGADRAPDDPARQTVRHLLQAAIANFYFIQRSAGQPNVMDRKYRVTTAASYRFRDGLLKGARAGATYVWRSPAAVAFRQVTVTDNPFVVPGLSSPTLTVSDPLNPIRGGALTSFDAFLGYSRRVFKNRITWDLQLNVRNVLDRRERLPQRALTSGQPVLFMLQSPRTLILTNSLSF